MYEQQIQIEQSTPATSMPLLSTETINIEEAASILVPMCTSSGPSCQQCIRATAGAFPCPFRALH